MIESAQAILVAALVICSLISCNGGPAAEPLREKERPPVPVTVAQVVQKDMPLEVAVVGQIEAYSTVALKARVSGPIVAVHFREGQEVREGDLLFTLDPTPYQVALKEAQARLARDQALARKAAADLTRSTSLADKAVVSRQEHEQLKAAAESAEATVRADMAAVENLNLQLGYCHIKSPISGRTGSLQANLGTLIKASDDNKYLVSINQIQPIYAVLALPEKYLGQVRRGLDAGRLKVQARIPDDPRQEEPLSGEITFVDNAVDMTTGTIRLKATFPNRDKRLWPGQFVDLNLILEIQTGAVVAPVQAIQVGQSGQFVFVLDPENKKVEMRPVQVARNAGEEAVVEKGLKPGEIVVTDGHLNLSPGARITVKEDGASGRKEVRS
ncbi:MAG: efflux RND transporter periplasmic adaptor subunit [Thermodesulfobacteriota bacterium]